MIAVVVVVVVEGGKYLFGKTGLRVWNHFIIVFLYLVGHHALGRALSEFRLLTNGSLWWWCGVVW